MTPQELLALANQAAETADNMNEAVKGGGGRLLPEGYAFGRLIEYVELGNHPQEFGGVAKEPAMEVQLAFALWGQGYQNEDGTPYIIRPWRFAISRNEKAKAFKLFKLLNWKNTAKTFAQLLSETYLVKIVNQAKSKTDSTLVSRVDLNGFLPPLDPVTRAPYAIQDVSPGDYRMFLWDHPNKTCWDSLYVEGKFDDGVSKNRTQEYILSALNFAGSPLELLLAGSGLALPAAAVAPPVAPAAPSVPVAPVAPAIAPTAPAVAPVAPLAPVPPVAALVAPVAAALPVASIAPVAPSLPAMPLPTSPSEPA